MASWTKLILAVFTFAFLLATYVLYVNQSASQNTSPYPCHSTLRNPTQVTRSISQRTEEPQNELNVYDGPAAALDEAGSRAPLTPTPRRPTQAARPTEPPFVGDSYMSGETAATTCANGIRSRVDKTVFGERYLKDIPVLQWAAHATRENYQRLSQYHGTHGWGDIDYKTLSEALSALNSTASSQMLDDWQERRNGSECSRCAVVGNGGILKDSGKGKEIDGHHYVFRTNGAVTRHFEQDVGSRTTHYIFSTNTLMNSMRSYSDSGFGGPPVSKSVQVLWSGCVG